MVAGAAAYPLIVQSAVDFRSDVPVDPDTGMHALSSYSFQAYFEEVIA